MNCDICDRPHNAKRRPFLCAVDARNRLYEGRLAQAKILMEHEELERQVNAALSAPAPTSAADCPSSARIVVDDRMTEQQQALNRTDQIIARADQLRADVTAARKEIEDRKALLRQRRSDLDSVSDGIAPRREKALDDAQKTSQTLKHEWNHKYASTMETRAFLCREAAKLYGLQRTKKAGLTKFQLGNLDIVELHSMNSLSPEAISTSLAHISHILVLCCHYLAIRLPAEITLPHRDYPRPTILSVSSSYRYKDVPFPGTGGVHAQLAPEGRDRERERAPHPRPLFIDKSLPTLAKEDPSTYSLFLEGVIYLAYDIAWVCCSQGVPIGDRSSFDDVCNMGRNLWNLLIGSQLHASPPGQLFPASSSPKGNINGSDSSDTNTPATWVGRYSHGTAHTFLGGADGTEFIRSFKLSPPLKLIDSLKRRLGSEMTHQEWELVQDGDMDDGLDEPIIVRGHGRRDSERRLFGVESMMTVRGGNEPPSNDSRTEKVKSSGWTRLKHR